MNSPHEPSDIANKGQALAEKAADKMQGGIHDAKQAAKSAAESALGTVSSLRDGAKQTIRNTSDKAQAMLDKATDAGQRAKELAWDTQDSIVAYTREQPVKSLLIAAATGAVLITLLRAFSSSKES